MRHAISIVILLLMTPFIYSTLHAQTQITSCSTLFTDHGGSNAQYQNDENSSWLICPDTTSEYLTVEFTFVDIETTLDTATYPTGCKDRLLIYDGMDDQAALIGSYCGEQSGSGIQPYDREHTLRVGDQFRPTNESGCFYVKFESNSEITKSGWIADISCCTPSLGQGTTDGVDLPLAENEGRLFDIIVDNSCIREGYLQEFTEWSPQGQSCFTSGLTSANRAFYAFQSNSSGGFVELEIEALDPVGNMEMLVFGPVTLESGSYTGGAVNDCVSGENPWPLFFNAGPNQTYILAIGTDLKGTVGVSALPSSIGLNGVLPVDLTSYTLINRNNTVTLEWTTATEINNSGFEIYRSTNGQYYDRIGWIDAKNSVMNRYSYQDSPDEDGDLYYYIQQVDVDGTITKYNILHTHIDQVSDISIYPNPSHGVLSTSYAKNGAIVEMMVVRVYDTMGSLRLVQSQQSTQDIDLTMLTDGLYVIEIEVDGRLTTQRHIISRS